ncbi:MAG TPA: RNA polymerase sigma factor [Planctomycetes bacterium]|nr:RNA polymerase sigma factor [Planctomycetota bacterium]
MSDWIPDITRLQEREDAEWLRVEREYCGRLLAYALRRTGDHQAAEDVVQETLLGAVRGIDDFDRRYTFEQYLFGICRNRTIDQMRRRKARTIQVSEDDEGFGGLESFAVGGETPSAIVRGRELGERARELLGTILHDWVEETWEQGEFLRLSVIEALFHGGWRNRDTWERFELRDETAVAGIKFRALKRLRQLAAVRESGSDLLALLARAEEGDHRLLDMDVQRVWSERRISCPARHWLARLAAGKLPEGPASFLRFHLEDMKCPWCTANYDDLTNPERERELMDLLRKVQESTDSVLQRRRSMESTEDE